MRSNPMCAMALAVASLFVIAPIQASDVDHYEGKPAENLEQAVSNLHEYNQRLEKILAQDELTAADLGKVHQLSYTLENALQRINEELATIAGDLETVHQASERNDAATVQSAGRKYLEQSNTLID